jgi:hypothetical protein
MLEGVGDIFLCISSYTSSSNIINADHGHYHGAHVLLGATLMVYPTLATQGEGGIHGG